MTDLTKAAELQEIRGKWCWFITLGALLVILGLVGMVYSVAATFTTVIFVGILLVIGGVGQVINAFFAIRWSGFFLMVFMGFLCIVLGVFVYRHPAVVAFETTLVIAIILIFGGAFRMVMAIAHRYAHWGLELLGGLISLLLGLALVREWPFSGLWFIGLCVSIELLMQGFSWLFFGYALKQVPKVGA